MDPLTFREATADEQKYFNDKTKGLTPSITEYSNFFVAWDGSEYASEDISEDRRFIKFKDPRDFRPRHDRVEWEVFHPLMFGKRIYAKVTSKNGTEFYISKTCDSDYFCVYEWCNDDSGDGSEDGSGGYCYSVKVVIFVDVSDEIFELREKVSKQDKIIEDLLKRIEKLENLGTTVATQQEKLDNIDKEISLRREIATHEQDILECIKLYRNTLSEGVRKFLDEKIKSLELLVEEKKKQL